MRQRKILIVHESRTIRNIIRNHLLVELEDVSIDFTASGIEAFDRLHHVVFDLVICGNEMKELDGIGVFLEMHREGKNKDTPFLMVTSSPSAENIRRFGQIGIEHLISTPFTPVDLADKVNKACNPRRWRREERFIINQLKAVFSVKKEKCFGQVINICSGGMLCDVTYAEPFPNLLSTPMVELIFPEKTAIPLESNILVKGEILRMGVLWRNDSRLPALIRTAWVFRDLTEDERVNLKTAIARAAEGTSDTEED